MATSALETAEQVTGEVDLFGPIMQQNFLLNEFNRQFAPIASLADGAPIEFLVKGADQLYLDLNDSYLHLRVKMTKADGANMDANTGAVINLPMHSLFREVSVEMNGKSVSEPNNLYPYRAYLETLVNFSRETQESRLLSEGWVRDKTGKMDVTAADGENTGLKDRATMFAQSKVVELVGRPHVDVFQQDRLIPPGIDLHMKLVPAANNFVCKSAAPGNNAAQENFKMKIEYAALVIHTKQLTDVAELAHRELLLSQNMKLPYTRVQVKHLSIPQNQTSYAFDNVFTGALPDLVVVGLVDDEDFAGGYQRNPFNFQKFGVNRIELKRNGLPVPREGYTPNWTTGAYIRDYLLFQNQLGFGKGDKCVNLTPIEWSDGFTIYAFKITDGPIGSGTEGPRSKSTTGSVRLEIGFSAAQNRNIKVIVLYQMLGVLEFDQFRNVIIS